MASSASPSEVARPWRAGAAVAALALACWAFLGWIAMDMDSPFAALMMPGSVDWELSNTLSILAMWSIMMAAMMLPSAWPMIRTFALVSARNREPARIEFKRLPGDF